ncbi:hypothetical protein [Amphritea sp. HPY]|uniref:hypothetical protein n=1 Tax=Amphritea sp. HPY TaxID=3421652 RepID=UPI003D7C87F8
MYTRKIRIWSLLIISIVALMVVISISAVSFPRNVEAARSGGGSPGYALMRCRLDFDLTINRAFLQVVGVTLDHPAYAQAIVAGGVDPAIDYENEYCEVAVQKFLAAGWEIHSIEFDGLDKERKWYYHFVSK